MSIRIYTILLLTLLSQIALIPISSAGSSDYVAVTIDIEPILRGNHIEVFPPLRGVEVTYGVNGLDLPRIVYSVSGPRGWRVEITHVELGEPIQLNLPKPVSEIPVLAREKRVNHLPEPVAPGSIVYNGAWYGYPISSAMIIPIRYEPGSTTLTFYKRIRISIKLLRGPIKGGDHMLGRMVYDETMPLADLKTYVGGSGEKPLLIVLTRRYFLSSTLLQEYLDLRSSQGYRVMLVTVEDIIESGWQGRDIPEAIRNYVEFLYNETNGRIYLLIIGDVKSPTYPNGPTSIDDLEPWEVPTRYFYNPDDYSTYTPSDIYYATMDSGWDDNGNGVYGESDDGADWYPDLAVGRLPFRSIEDLDSYLNRLLYNSSKGLPELLLAGSIAFYLNEDNGGSYMVQGDTELWALWTHIKSLAPSWMLPVNVSTLFEHYPPEEVIDDPSDINGNVSYSSFSSTVASRSPWMIMVSGHGSYTGIFRKIWSQDDGDCVPESDEMVWERFIDMDSFRGNLGLQLSVACMSAGYDYDTQELVDSFLLHGLWYLGWNRVTYIYLYTAEEELDPDVWGLSQGTAYRFTRYLLSTDSPSIQDVGYSYTYALTWLAQNEDMESQYSRRVWLAFTLLGDPSQLYGRVSTFIGNTSIAPVPDGLNISGILRAFERGEESPVAGAQVEVYLDGEFKGANVTDPNGSFTFTVTGIEEGFHNITVKFSGSPVYMPSSASFSAVITESPRLEVFYQSIPPGGWSPFTASGLIPGVYRLIMDDREIAEFHADDVEYQGYIQIPLDTSPGIHIVELVLNDTSLASDEIRVTEPLLTVIPSQVEPMDPVNVTVVDAGYGQIVIVDIDGIPLTPPLSTGTGSISVNITVPPLPAGMHDIRLEILPPEEIRTPERISRVASAKLSIVNGAVLENRVEVLEQRVAMLENLVQLLSARLDTVNKTLAEMIYDLNESLADLSLIVSSHDSAINENSRAILSLESGINMVNYTLTSRIESLNTSILSVKTMLGTLKAEMAALRSEVSRLNESTMQEIQVLGERLSSLQEMLESMNNDIERLEALYTRLNSTLSSLKLELLERINIVEGEVASVNTTCLVLLNNLYSRLSALNSTLAENILFLRESLDSLISDTEELRARMEGVEFNTSSTALRLKTLEDRVGEMEKAAYAALVISVASLSAAFIVLAFRRRR